jgi:type I restriction enzyme S subunit
MAIEDTKPYDVHSSWKWYKMDELVHFQGGSQPPKAVFVYEPREGYTRLVQIRDFKSDANLTFVPSEKANRLFSKDDVMIGRYGPPVFQILRGLEGTYNVALMKASPKSDLISNDFIFWLLQESRIHDEVVRESERTAGQTGVRLPLLRSFLVALPPLAEQHRIVAKVEALMALCDQMEAGLTTTAATRSKLLGALLHEALEPAADELEAVE